MKSFSILDLEKVIDPDIFDAGLQLVEEGIISGIKEIETNLWVARTSLEIEPELLISRDKVKTYSCDCQLARSGNICEHIAGTAILFRRERNRPTSKTKRTTSKKKAPPKKITTAHILNMVSEQEIKDFVRKYARSNRQFAVSLKTKFAHLFQSEDTGKKYGQVLETIIKTHVGRSAYLKVAKLRRLLKNLDELLDQAENALAQNHYGDVFSLLSNFIEYVVPVVWKSKGDDLLVRLDRAFQLLNQLVQKDISPELQEKMAAKMIEECPKFKYRSGETTAKFFFSLGYLYERMGQLDMLSDFIEEQVKDSTWGHWLMAEWQVFRYRIASTLEKEEVCKEIMAESILDRPLFNRMIKDAELRNDKNTLKYLIETAKEQDSGILNNMALHTEKILLSMAKEEKNKRNLVIHAEKLFLDTLDLQYFELLKQNISKYKWSSFFARLIDKITSNNKYWVQKEAVAELLAREKKIAGLFHYIQQIKSLTLLSKYETVLLNNDRLKYIELFESMAMDHAKHHLGEKNARFLSEKIATLINGKEKSFAQELIRKLQTEYPQRRSLMNELSRIS